MIARSRASTGAGSFLSRLVHRYAVRNRRRKARLVLDIARRGDLRTVLLVGAAVTGNPQDGIVENILAEQLDVLSACNIAAVPLPWPAVVGDARALPYRTAAVDLVVSNAVVEHVGDALDQRRFVAEHDRVGRAWVITTPNRHFPVEPHTSTALRHYRRAWRDEQHDFTRMLTKREFRRLLPPGAKVIGHVWSPTLIAVGGVGHVTTQPARPLTSVGGRASRPLLGQRAATAAPSALGSRAPS